MRDFPVMMSKPVPRTAVRAAFGVSIAAAATLFQACAMVPRSSLTRDPELAPTRPSLPSSGKVYEKALPSAGKSSDPSTAALPELQRLYQKGLYSELISRARSWEEDPASARSPSATRAAIFNLYGMGLLLTSRPSEAEQRFQLATMLASDRTLRSYHAFNWAAALSDQSKWTEARQAMDTNANLALLDPIARAKATSLRSKLLLQTGDFAGSARGWLELQSAFRERFDRDAVADLLRQSLAGISDAAVLADLRRNNEKSEILDEVLNRQGELAVEGNDQDLARDAFRALLDGFPRSTHVAAAESALRRMREDAPVRSMTIGALLPMTGKFARFGRKTLQGLELALGILGKPDKNGASGRITLVVEDSGEEPEKALAALERLHTVDHVQLVIGPMTSKGIEAITRRSEDLGLPLLTLAQQSGIDGDYIFPIGLTAEAQTRALARHAIQQMKLKRFAIAYPRNKFGEQYAFAFWDAVESLGGGVRGVESYDETETDFRGIVDRLIGLDPLDARGRELGLLAREREEQNITKRTSKTERYFSVPPLSDFDAVFIADEPKRAAQIVPTFEFRDVVGLHFIGNASWNSPDLLQRMPVQAESALFTDAFFNSSENSSVRKFTEEYTAVFGQEPSNLESLAYDAGTLARRAIEGLPKDGSREDVRTALRSMRQFNGVSGRILMDEDGGWERILPVLTVRDGRIVSAER